MSPLYARLHLWAVTPHEWGFTDCYMTLADWVRDQTGRDPGEHLRGSYGDPAVCPLARRYLRDPVPVVGEACRNAGLKTVSEQLKPGDVGILRQNGNRFLIGGLYLGGNWASKTLDHGVLFFQPARVVWAWEGGYAH